MVALKSTEDPQHVAPRKRAELLSAVGAGVLGAGLALLIAELLAPYAVAILIVGLCAHAWGMFWKHRLESQASSVRLWWAELLYWSCWVALALLVVVIAMRSL